MPTRSDANWRLRPGKTYLSAHEVGASGPPPVKDLLRHVTDRQSSPRLKKMGHNGETVGGSRWVITEDRDIWIIQCD